MTSRIKGALTLTVRVPRACKTMSDGAVALEGQVLVAKCIALGVTLRCTSSDCGKGFRACHRVDMQVLIRFVPIDRASFSWSVSTILTYGVIL